MWLSDYNVSDTQNIDSFTLCDVSIDYIHYGFFSEATHFHELPLESYTILMKTCYFQVLYDESLPIEVIFKQKTLSGRI